MKKFSPFLFILMSMVILFAPQKSEAEAFKAGSYIVDWGVQPQSYANGLYPYGLLFDLVIRDEIPVYWIIKKGKPLMGIDFSYNGKDYMGSALVIPAVYVNASVLATINYWRGKGVTIDGPTATDFDAPAYNYITSFPNAVVDQQNVKLVQDLFYNHVYISADNRGIPPSYYITGTPKDITACSDVYALPHADPQDPSKWTIVEQSTYDNYIKNAKGFLWQGCHSVGAVEAHKPNFLGMYILTTNGQIAWKNDPDYAFTNTNSPAFEHEVSAGDNPIMQIADYVSHNVTGGGPTAAQSDGSQRIYIPRPDSAWRSTTTVAVWDPDNANLSLNGGNPNKAALIAFGRAYGDPTNGIVVQQASHTSKKGTEPENVSAARFYGNLLLQSAIEKRPNVTISSPSDLYYPNSYEMHADVSRGTEPFTFTWSITCKGTNNPGTFSNQVDANRTSTVTFTPANETLDGCILRVKVTDQCNRKNFDTKIVGITGYHPPLGYFNVTHAGEDFTNSNNQDPLLTTHPANSLYTQISGKNFNVRLVALGADKVTPVASSSTALLELIDTAGVTELDPSSCTKAYSYATVGGYDFNGNAMMDVGPINYPYSRHEIGFRIRYYDFSSSTTGKTYGIPNDKTKADLDNTFPQCASSCVTAPPTDWGCYECITKYYGDSVCARDNFSIRPDHYNIGLHGTPPFIGGRAYPLEINATNFAGANDIWYSDKIVNNVVNDRIFDAPNAASLSSVLVLPATCTSLASATPEIYQNSIAFIQGAGRTDSNTPLQFTYHNVGDVNITAVESKWVSLADTNKNYVNGTPYEKNDCIVGSGSNAPDANGKIGCMIRGVRQIHFIPSYIKNALRIEDYNNPNQFTYISSDESANTTYGAKVKITHTAMLDDNGVATNYTAGCFAHNLNSTLSFTKTDILRWSDMQNRIWVYDINSSTLLSKTGTSPAKFDYTIPQTRFNAGNAKVEMFFDFTRRKDIADNPITIDYTDFNIPIVTDTVDTTVTGSDFNRTAGNPNESTVTFLYARAKPNQFFYDNITAASVRTPVSIVVYCGLPFAQCQNSGLTNIVNGVLADARSNESSWWFAQNHSIANRDGNVTLTASNGTVIPTDPASIGPVNGIDKTVTVSGTAPNIVNINLGANTSDRLIYNKDADVAPAPFYKVRFIGTGGWTGEGKTGHVVGDDINTKKSRRVEW